MKKKTQKLLKKIAHATGEEAIVRPNNFATRQYVAILGKDAKNEGLLKADSAHLTEHAAVKALYTMVKTRTEMTLKRLG